MSSRRPTPFVAILCAFLCMMEGAMLRVYAGLFIVDPHAGSTCQAGVPCTVSWVDDGMRPLFSAIGVSTVALYTGKQQLVQRIAPVDVTKQASLTFVPIAGAGPDSDAYYIAITSTTAKGNDTTTLYSGWSPFFRITGMSGSFDSPLAAATKEIPIPASLTQSTASIASSAQSTTVTITIGAPTTTPSSSVPSTASSARTSQNASASSSKPTTSAAVASASASASASANSVTTASRLVTSLLPSSSATSPSVSTSSTPSPSSSSSSPSSIATSSSSSNSSSSNNSTLPSGARSLFSRSALGLGSIAGALAIGVLGAL